MIARRALVATGALVAGVGCGALALGASGFKEAQPIVHRLFDANHCLQRIERSEPTRTVVMHWGCGAEKMISMTCVYDRLGYQGLGPEFARSGWHCNYPLPVLVDEWGSRASDVAVGDVGGPVYWAACFVSDYGAFDARVKPYHGSGCWKALRRIGEAVRRQRSSPAEAVRTLPP